MDKMFPLLVSDCLTAPERLILFRTDKTLAEAVLQNSASIKLSVGGEGQACNSEQLATAMRLASDARPHVQLTMRHRLFTPPEALWQRLTILTLAEQQLSMETFTAFRQSHRCQHLHTLRLQRCTLQPMGQSGSSPEAGLSIRTLECVQCLPTSSYLATALCLTNTNQLQQLSTEGGEDATGYLRALPQLKQLRMVRVAVGDLRFQRILSHPTLTHVTLDELPLYQDHSAAQPPSLQDITLLRGCSIATLALLPLASIRRCVIQHELKFEGGEGVCGAMLDAALCRVAPYQDKVVCKSTPRKDYWDPLAPVFQLDFSSRCTMQHMQQAITVCTRHLEGVLMLVRPPDTVLAALAAALPTTITTLCFHGATQPLQPYLPSHVEHVVLASCRRTMSQIHQIVTGVTRPITFTFHGLVVPDFVRPTADERLAWFQAQIRTWLASCPNRVQVAVVGGIKGY